jgi:hypothetical protein
VKNIATLKIKWMTLMELARPNVGDATSSHYQSNLFCHEVLLEKALGQMGKYPLYKKPTQSIDDTLQSQIRKTN